MQVTPAELIFILPVAALIGALVGSFLNVVIYRLPVMLERAWQQEARDILELEPPADQSVFNLATPPSRCNGCGGAIKPWQNIPIISWLLQRGKCRNCSSAISLQYPLVEASCALLTATAAWQFGASWQTVAAIIFTWFLLAGSIIDLNTKLLPDNITLPLLWLGLIVSLFPWSVTPEQAIVGAAMGYLSLWSVYQLFKLLTGKEGMGFGDFKLLAALGAWCGWEQLPTIILLSSMAGAIIGIAWLKLGDKHKDTAMPFGPYLAIAGWLAYLWGPQMTNAYLGYMNGTG